jgi:hypothetical protein
MTEAATAHVSFEELLIARHLPAASKAALLLLLIPVNPKIELIHQVVAQSL